jgi:hypothetical protein
MNMKFFNALWCLYFFCLDFYCVVCLLNFFFFSLMIAGLQDFNFAVELLNKAKEFAFISN